MPENQKYRHRKKIMQKYRINKLLFIIKKLIDKKKLTKRRIKKEGDESRKEGDVCKDCKWIRTTLLLMPRYNDFS